MKSLIVLFIIFFMACSNGQIYSDYQINFSQHPTAVKYFIFFEERDDTNQFLLQDSVDYLEPIDLSELKIAETTSAIPVTIRLKNNGRLIRAGVVVEDTAGYYSVMGVSSIYAKGTIPDKLSNVSITRVVSK